MVEKTKKEKGYETELKAARNKVVKLKGELEGSYRVNNKLEGDRKTLKEAVEFHEKKYKEKVEDVMKYAENLDQFRKESEDLREEVRKLKKFADELKLCVVDQTLEEKVTALKTRIAGIDTTATFSGSEVKLWVLTDLGA